MDDVRVIEVKEHVFASNARNANDVRARCKEQGLLLINLMSSPGAGKTTLLSATIVASTAAAADAYATYCMVIGFDEARAFIESRPDLEGYLIRDADGTMLEWASPGFTLR